MKKTSFFIMLFIWLIYSNVLNGQTNPKQLLYSEFIESTNSTIDMYKIQKPNNTFIIQIIISVKNPSPLGNANYLGEGLVYLIVPETMYVYYDAIDIKLSHSAASDNYLNYEPPSGESNQVKKLGVFLLSMLPYIGQVIGSTAFLFEETNTNNFSNANNYIDRNKYDAVDISWLMKAFKYYQKIKIEIPVKAEGDFEIGLYANWATNATDEISDPIFKRVNKSYPGFITNPIEKVNDRQGTFTDSRDGQTYNIVTIGSQTWFAENLNYETNNSWCYDNNSSNCNVYGRLYTWDAALTACPLGWHLPSDDEWKQLEMYLGISQNEADALGWRGTDIGKKLKSKTDWYSNGNGVDAVGFNALPGGGRNLNGFFVGKDTDGFWWTANSGWRRDLNCSYDKIRRVNFSTENGASVRCVKD